MTDAPAPFDQPSTVAEDELDALFANLDLPDRPTARAVRAQAAMEQCQRDVEVWEHRLKEGGPAVEIGEALKILRAEMSELHSMACEREPIPAPSPAESSPVRVTMGMQPVAANDPGPPAAPANDASVISGSSCEIPDPIVDIHERLKKNFEHPPSWEAFRAAADAMTDRDILHRLEELVPPEVDVDPLGYLRRRAEEFALNVVLNDRKGVAPAFRRFTKAKRGKEIRPIDKWIVGDRTVIDVHWHYATGELNPVPGFASLCEKDFSFTKAAEIARRLMIPERKAKALGLAESAQLFGTMLQTESGRGRRRTIQGRIEALRRTLADRRRDARYHLTWRDIQELENAAWALFIARGRASVASQFMVHVGGASTSEQRMRHLKKRLARTYECAPRGWGEGPDTSLADDRKGTERDAAGVPPLEMPDPSEA